jgi:Asp-tRNA(Asn)/Glu-tRNA(Gln) amidotransferase A subunit family amidase
VILKDNFDTADMPTEAGADRSRFHCLTGITSPG